jgi:hypothetical protein
MRLCRIKRTICPVLAAVLVIVTAGPVLADSNSIARSLLVPGTGQAHQGHYTKAAIFAGAAVVSGVGLLLSQVHYNQAVMRYNDLRDIYLGYPATLEGGTTVLYSEITGTYDDMQAAWDESDSRKTWRNVFLGAFIATYALNLVDVILNKPETGERPEEATIGFQMDQHNIRVFKTFDF